MNYEELVAKVISGELSRADLEAMIEIQKELNKREENSGHRRWFKTENVKKIVNGDDEDEFGLFDLPKHRAIIQATKTYKEILVLGGNRTGKTKLGTYLTSIFATGDYPRGWEGRVWRHPTHQWSVGKSKESVRDTLQESLLGPLGSQGTGLIPKELLGKITHKNGVPGACDTVEVKYLENDEWTGAWSTIGFKSGDQGAPAFFGTAKHHIHGDEPMEELVYNECLLRTMSTKGFITQTVTPKAGLTRMLADHIADSDLLAGTENMPNLELARALIRQEQAGRDNDD